MSTEVFPETPPLLPFRGLRPRLAQSPVTLALLGLTVATTLVQLGIPALRVVSRLGVGAPVLTGEWWRLLTYLFPQLLGLPHLALNGLGLALYGPFLERRIGRLGMFVTYIVAGVVGGAWLIGAGQRRLNAGASLALFGVVAALATANVIFARANKVPAAAMRRSLLLVAALTALLWPIEAASYVYEGRDLTLGLSFWGIVRHSPGHVAGIPLGLAFAMASLRKSVLWPSFTAVMLVGAAIAFVVFRVSPWPLWPS